MSCKLYLFLAIVVIFQMRVEAEVYTVNSNSDDKDNPTYGMFRYFVNNAHNGDTIYFAVDNVKLDTTIDFSYWHNLLIDGGSGVVLDINKNGTIFNISFAKLVLKNLTLQNALGEDYGGGMYAFVSSENDLLVENCTFINNTVTSTFDGQGGGVRTNNGVYLNCRFLNNKVIGSTTILGGGGVFASEGKFINCVFAGNVAAYGGGMYASKAKVINCTFTQNRVTGANNGGGISCENSSIVNSIIYNNLALGFEDNIDIISSAISYCALEPGNSLVGSNHIIALTETPFKHTTGADSLSLKKGSPCINAGNTEIVDLPNLDILGNNRIYGSSVDFGAFESVPPTWLITKKTDSKDNPVNGSLRHALLNAQNGDIIQFVVDSVYSETTFTLGDKSLVFISKNVNPTVITGDYSFTIFDIDSKSNSLAILFENIEITKGGGDYGGVVAMGRVTHNIDFNHCVFKDNKGLKYGAANLFFGGKLYNCTFKNNVAQSANRYDAAGGISAEGISFDNCNFIGNKAYSSNVVSVAGALYTHRCTVSNCLFENNYADGKNASGGAIASENSTFVNCHFNKNSVNPENASSAGGAVSNDNSSFINCTFTKNTGSNKLAYPTQAGGIFVKGGKIVNCLFTENAAADAGGMSVYNRDYRVDVINCTFTKNKATLFENITCGGFSLVDDYSLMPKKYVLVKNTLSYNNEPTNYYNGNDTALIAYSAIGDTLVAGTGNIKLDKSPFQNALANDYYFLKENSDCINAGDTLGILALLPEKDAIQNNRFNNGIDIGAIEYNERLNPIINWPTTSAITYGDSLGLAINNDGAANIDGYFTFDSAAFYSPLQNKVEIVFTPIMVLVNDYKSISDTINLTIKKALLNVVVDNDTVTYGEKEPKWNLNYSGFVNNDSIENLNILPTCSVTNYNLLNAGTYQNIIKATGGEDTNYEFVYIDGTLTILKGLNVKSNVKNDLNIYPNPVIDNVTINVDELVGKQVIIYNSQGIVIYIEEVTDNTLSLSHLKKGIYIIEINGLRKKIIKN